MGREQFFLTLSQRKADVAFNLPCSGEPHQAHLHILQSAGSWLCWRHHSHCSRHQSADCWRCYLGGRGISARAQQHWCGQWCTFPSPTAQQDKRDGTRWGWLKTTAFSKHNIWHSCIKYSTATPTVINLWRKNDYSSCIFNSAVKTDPYRIYQYLNRKKSFSAIDLSTFQLKAGQTRQGITMWKA